MSQSHGCATAQNFPDFVQFFWILKNTNPQLKITNWSCYHQLVISTFSSLLCDIWCDFCFLPLNFKAKLLAAQENQLTLPKVAKRTQKYPIVFKSTLNT